MEPEFILHFKGRLASETYDQNFLWKFGSVYIMDNHRAALWCWLQHINKNKKYNLLHIDKHCDCLGSRIDEWLEVLPQGIESLTFEEYLRLSYLPSDSPMQKKVPIVRFDNYLSIFLKRYASSINKCIFATHGKGDPPNWDNKTEIPDFQLVSYVSHSLGEGEWINLYNRRTAIERVNSRLEYERRLDCHCFRGLNKIRLHCSLAILSLLAEALAKAQKQRFNELRVCARKIA